MRRGSRARQRDAVRSEDADSGPARDFAQTNPAFAIEAELAALRWLVRGDGCEIAPLDVRAVYSHTLTAAASAGVDGAVRTRIRALFDDPAARSGFVASVIGKEMDLD